MFFTKMQINAARRDAQRLMSSPQMMHAAVLAGFPNSVRSDEGRVLWRLDPYERHRVFLYVVSPDKPDFTHLVEQAGWPTTETWTTEVYDPFLESLRVGERCRFRLTANPVHSVRRPGWSDTKPVGHVTVKCQEKWLLDRSERLGFRVLPSSAPLAANDIAEPDLAVVDRSFRRFKREDVSVTIAMATFEGTLEVVEADALRHALTHGIGRAKAYGCGLLTIARLPSIPSTESKHRNLPT